FDLNIPNSLAMKAIGYKELKPYFDGTSTLLECKEVLKQKTRNYAKRQFTFINQFNDAIIVQYNGIKDTAKKMMSYLE
ncbi:MAG: tRNA (adenosine(37)-N6)-dimethylallyltransferase MiaA, partial [Clostridia bacterium]|nr:tRNA (adenosine(37)-N6)-dimethylallyltransferase MiaA [Clostridia bacterium]